MAEVNAKRLYEHFLDTNQHEKADELLDKYPQFAKKEEEKVEEEKPKKKKK